ncbi:peptidoglycan-binding domain-containing protein [Streptomyces sp. 7N604]|uniref:peptidoglycan-binding domain-containing protein n=1 Tax=Streptomyces sp. 7N604 TaxID=3457415 RepID=UPI003FD28654
MAVAASVVIGSVLVTAGLLNDDRTSDDESRPRNPYRAASLEPTPGVAETGSSPGPADRSGAVPSSVSAGSLASGTGGDAKGTRRSPDADSPASGLGDDGASMDPAPPATGGSSAGGIAEDGSSGLGEIPVLSEGDRGPEVVKLQQLLEMSPADGIYDEEVTRKVHDFQSEKGINDDPLGVYGPSTRHALEA